MKKLLAAVVVGVFIASSAAVSSPVQLSLTPDLALVDQHERVEGVSLGIWSENPQTAFTVGIVSGSAGQSSGFSYGLLANYAENYKGVHWGLVNYTAKEFVGWQGGFVNYTEGSMTGVQTGTVNYAGELTGLQWGLVNYAEMVNSGLQLGLVNLIPQNELLTNLPNELAPGMVMVNWRF